MSEALMAADSTEQASEAWEQVHRVVFPAGDNAPVWPLYVEWGRVVASDALTDYDFVEPIMYANPRKPHKWDKPLLHEPPAEYSRRSVTVPGGEYMSFATYFNAFPAAHWQRWTDAKKVRLTLTLEGEAEVLVQRSSGEGSFKTIESRQGTGEMSFEMPLNRYASGGWLWFDVRPIDGPVTVSDAGWSVPDTNTGRKTKLTVGITTFNMADECIEQAWRFINNPGVLERIAEILIIDQGTQKVKDNEGYPEVKAKLGDQLRVIEQDNIGGSGGFARNMYETLKNPDSDYVLLTDDDAAAEPEGVQRALQFGDHTLKPTIVGGHMFDLLEPTRLLALAETVDMNKFWWHPVGGMIMSPIDWAQRTLRNDILLSRRMDAAYNGWWMCLIPKAVIEKIGLSMPFFIKWDDCEYSLRARSAGIPTVSLPGAAVWHEAWQEKQDALDWQSYFHQRNRLVSGLLHSPRKKGGSLLTASFRLDFQHLLSMQYFAADMRARGLEDVLRGPGHLHETLRTRAAEARAEAKEYGDSNLITDPRDYPETVVIGEKPERDKPTTQLGVLAGAAKGALHQLKKVHNPEDRRPFQELISSDARWFNLSILDSALVNNASGSGVWVYRRDRTKFLDSLKKAQANYRKLRKDWERLAREYREALPEITSPEAWEKTFGIR